jgi:hypothetical protein
VYNRRKQSSGSIEIRVGGMLMPDKCSNCGRGVGIFQLGGYRDELGIFCSTRCQSFFHYPRFCETCMSVTTDESAGSTRTLNGCGTKLHGAGVAQCPVCGAFVQTKSFCIFDIPLISFGQYLFKWPTSDRYISRRLK